MLVNAAACANFVFVEAFAIYCVYVALRKEGVRVHFFNETVNVQCFRLSAVYDEHFYFLSGVPACSVDDCATAVQFVVYASGDFVPMLREDCELYCLSCVVYHLVCHEREEYEYYVSVYYFVEVLVNEE